MSGTPWHDTRHESRLDALHPQRFSREQGHVVDKQLAHVQCVSAIELRTRTSMQYRRYVSGAARVRCEVCAAALPCCPGPGRGPWAKGLGALQQEAPPRTSSNSSAARVASCSRRAGRTRTSVQYQVCDAKRCGAAALPCCGGLGALQRKAVPRASSKSSAAKAAASCSRCAGGELGGGSEVHHVVIALLQGDDPHLSNVVPRELFTNAPRLIRTCHTTMSDELATGASQHGALQTSPL